MVYRIIGDIVTPHRVIEDGEVEINGSRISYVGEKRNTAEKTIDCTGQFVSPGFIDMHTHGAGGYDFMEATEEAFLEAGKTHAAHGTTTLLPTSMACPDETLFDFLNAYQKVRNTKRPGPHMPGVHLEGPFFADSQKGAQPTEYFKKPSVDYAQKVLNICPHVLRWSGAPELEGGYALGRYLYDRGILASIAHSDATLEEAVQAFENGYTHLTHFYSGMSQLKRVQSYRIPGLIDSGYMFSGFQIEIIADGHHLPPSLLRHIYRSIGPERISLVTDSTRAAGTDAKETFLGVNPETGIRAIIDNGVAKLPDKSSFAGSIATTDLLVRNMLRYADCGICDAVKMMTRTPAVLLGLKKKGALTVGYDADIAVFDRDVRIAYTIVNGEVVYEGGKA